MRIAYVFDQVLPSSATDTEQVLNTVAALGRRGVDVTLVLPEGPRPGPPDADALREYYQVDGPFEVMRLRSYPPGRLRLGEKVGHAARAMAEPRLRGFDVVYTRNVPSLLAGVLARHPVVYETYRPWPDQRPLVRPAFRAAMSRPNFLGGVFHSEFARGPSVGNVPSWLSTGLGLMPKGEPHDGTVTVAETRVSPMAAFATVEASHTWIMNHPETRRLVLRFLESGGFDP